MPFAILAFHVHAVLGVDLRHECIAHECPCVRIQQLWSYFRIKRNAAVLFGGRHGSELAPMQCGCKLKVRR